GFPLGPNLAERVVFNGYFLKILKYEAGDVPRGAPLLVGRIGWDPGQSAAAQPGSGSTLKWTLILLGLMFLVTLARWIASFARSMRRDDRATTRFHKPADEIDPATLEQWLQRAGDDEDEPARDAEEPAEPRA